MTNRRKFFRELSLGLSAGLFLPQLIKPAWRLPAVSPIVQWPSKFYSFDYFPIAGAPVPPVKLTWTEAFEKYVNNRYRERISFEPLPPVISESLERERLTSMSIAPLELLVPIQCVAEQG